MPNREPFQAFRNTRQREVQGRRIWIGDQFINHCWDSLKNDDSVSESVWIKVYRTLQGLPYWGTPRLDNHACAAEMLHMTSLLHYVNAVISRKELFDIASGSGKAPQHDKYNHFGVQRHYGTFLSSLLSSVDTHCCLLCALLSKQDAAVDSKLQTFWSLRQSDRGRLEDSKDLFNQVRAANKLIADMEPAIKDLRRRRRVFIHGSFSYVVPHKVRGWLILRDDLSYVDFVAARELAAPPQGGWHRVSGNCFEGELQPIVERMVDGARAFVKASTTLLV